MHFRPAAHWLNDPNGLVFHEGVYHLYFQHNPYGDSHANMSWGHATSTDLLTWAEHDVAILCDDEEEVYSGSVVVDHENTGGFGSAGQTALVAVYTSAHRATRRQAQSLAYSLDDGMTWTRYEGNPVLDRGSLEFRDPKVFRWTGAGEQYWVMVAVEAAERRVVLYRSEDLRSWRFLSSFGPAGAVGGVWECPDLFPLAVDGDPDRVRWVLIVSLYPGAIAGGSGTQYFVGRFDGVVFTADHALPAAADPRQAGARWLDHGRDCYAGVTFSGLPDDERTLMAWMGNWDYARLIDPDPARGAMTVARRLSLVAVDGDVVLRQEPVLPALGEPVRFDEVPLPGAWHVPAPLPPSAVVDLVARLDGAEGVAVRLRHGEAQHGGVVVRVDRGVLLVDRTESPAGTHPGLSSVEVAPLRASDRVALRIVVDRRSIEVFADGGITVVTDLVDTVAEADGLTIEPLRGAAAIESLAVRPVPGGDPPAGDGPLPGGG